MRKSPRILVLLYVLIGYVILQFGWWAYLIFDLNSELILQADSFDHISNPEQLIRSKFLMIMGEGSVFLGLLLLGGWYIRKYILKENRLLKQEKTFLLATTHEFNSPIASIKLNLQTLKKREVTPEIKSKMLDGALEANQRIENLVANILMASKLDSGKVRQLKEEIDVTHFMREMEKQFQFESPQAPRVIFEANSSSKLMADRKFLDLILSNLIGNALKYGNQKDVFVSVKEENKELIFSVKDQGSGISADEQRHIFRKFYRIENEETRSQKGTGLGLYLVWSLCSIIGARIDLSSSQTGTVFSVIFTEYYE